MSYHDSQGVWHEPLRLVGDDAHRISAATKEWTVLAQFWQEVVCRAIDTLIGNAGREIEAALQVPLEQDEDVIVAITTTIRRLRVVCMARPSLTCIAYDFGTRYTDGGLTAIITVRMPIAKWNIWSLAAADFCEAMYSNVNLRVTAPDYADNRLVKFVISEVSIDYTNASANPHGAFTFSMKYARLPKNEEAIE